MAQQSQPHYHDLTMLPMIGEAIDGMADSARTLYATLQEAKTNPMSLDDATILPVIAQYSEQQTFFPYFQEQLARWLRARPTREQRVEIERLQAVLTQLIDVVKRLLVLAQKLSQFTIERILAMSDVEVAQRHLTAGFVVVEDEEI